MRRTAIVEKPRKLLKHGTRKPIIPWINYFGTNPPPVGYNGPVLNFTIVGDKTVGNGAKDDISPN